LLPFQSRADAHSFEPEVPNDTGHGPFNAIGRVEIVIAANEY
jgi:hypothetical protein